MKFLLFLLGYSLLIAAGYWAETYGLACVGAAWTAGIIIGSRI